MTEGSQSCSPSTASSVGPGRHLTERGSGLLDAHGRRAEGPTLPAPSRGVRATTRKRGLSKASRGVARCRAPVEAVAAHQAWAAGGRTAAPGALTFLDLQLQSGELDNQALSFYSWTLEAQRVGWGTPPGAAQSCGVGETLPHSPHLA